MSSSTVIYEVRMQVASLMQILPRQEKEWPRKPTPTIFTNLQVIKIHFSKVSNQQIIDDLYAFLIT